MRIRRVILKMILRRKMIRSFFRGKKDFVFNYFLYQKRKYKTIIRCEKIEYENGEIRLIDLYSDDDEEMLVEDEKDEKEEKIDTKGD